LVRGDEIVLGEDQLDLVAEVGEGGEEVVDGLALTGTPARLAVVDEVGAEQALAGSGVTLVDRLTVEAADQFLVGVRGYRRDRSRLPSTPPADTVSPSVASSSSSPSSRHGWRCSRCSCFPIC
jgi:hypothetical protein